MTAHADVHPGLSRVRECARDCGADCHDCWSAAVSAELVACTLGARRQPELEVSSRFLRERVPAQPVLVRGDGIEPPTTPV